MNWLTQTRGLSFLISPYSLSDKLGAIAPSQGKKKLQNFKQWLYLEKHNEEPEVTKCSSKGYMTVCQRFSTEDFLFHRKIFPFIFTFYLGNGKKYKFETITWWNIISFSFSLSFLYVSYHFIFTVLTACHPTLSHFLSIHARLGTSRNK